jgi:hypothetical protein
MFVSGAPHSRAAREKVMSSYRIYSIESAPEKSKPALQDLKNAFGFIPNIAGVVARRRSRERRTLR